MTVRQTDPEMESIRAPRSLIILGSLAQVHIQFVGQIFLCELFLYAIWVFRTKHCRLETGLSEKNSKIDILQKLLMCMLAAQLITDILRGINFIEMAKGSSLILFTIFNLKLYDVLSMLVLHLENCIITVLPVLTRRLYSPVFIIHTQNKCSINNAMSGHDSIATCDGACC